MYGQPRERKCGDNFDRCNSKSKVGLSGRVSLYRVCVSGSEDAVWGVVCTARQQERKCGNNFNGFRSKSEPGLSGRLGPYGACIGSLGKVTLCSPALISISVASVGVFVYR